MKRFSLLVAILVSQISLCQDHHNIHGAVLGYDGKPMKKANVQLLSVPAETALMNVEVANDGKYTLDTDAKGLFRIQFSGVDHSSHGLMILLDSASSLGLNVTLKLYDYSPSFDAISVVTATDNFNPSKGTKLVRQSDGTYATTLETKDKTVAYQLANLEASGRTINGQASDDYTYDNGGDYISTVSAVAGKVRIVFDPKRIARSSGHPLVTFNPPNPIRETFAQIINDAVNDNSSFIMMIRSAQAAGKDPREVAAAYDWSAANKRIENQLKTEHNPLLRQALMLTYFTVGGTSKDTLIAKEAIQAISPVSLLWALNPTAIFAMVSTAHRDSFLNEYLDKIIDGNPDPAVRSLVLFNGLMQASYAGKPETAQKYYDRLLKEFPESREAAMAKQGFAPNRAVQVGKALPAFSIAALHEPSRMITKDDLKGKFVLIDFWAVWCGPCVREMASLHKAYDRFAVKGLQILSLSFDEKPEDVDAFRKDKWRMPWLHAFVKGGFESSLAKQFEVVGIPKPILVDKNGTIVAMEGDLRGENLERTLAKYLGE